MLCISQGFFDLLIAAQAPASDAIQSQEVNVLTGNSSLLWQLGEFCAQEPSVPPNVNLGPAVRNSNGQTGI